LGSPKMLAKTAKGGWHQLGSKVGGTHWDRKCLQKPRKVGGTNWGRARAIKRHETIGGKRLMSPSISRYFEPSTHWRSRWKICERWVAPIGIENACKTAMGGFHLWGATAACRVRRQAWNEQWSHPRASSCPGD
jgi:hypothetical protein